MKLIVGLGNPGAEYAGTRHNAGFAVVGELAAKHGVRVSGRSYQSLIGRGKIGGASVYLQQPLTYMNRCGQAVKSAVVALEIDLSDLLVISDDLDLPLGSLRIRAQGGAGGQKGLQSISDCLGTTEFARLRLGIGRPLFGLVNGGLCARPLLRGRKYSVFQSSRACFRSGGNFRVVGCGNSGQQTQ
ncbi:MAG: Peptidyl-tRNA hydrolase [Firmicutes bacterium]|nr:Peptidyl-tRNA hydrolase [candidate division NPL-UPA2 bacterium]